MKHLDKKWTIEPTEDLTPICCVEGVMEELLKQIDNKKRSEIIKKL